MEEPKVPIFTVIDGGLDTDADDYPFSLPVIVREYPGLRVIKNPGQPALFEVEYAVFDLIPDNELSFEGAMVRMNIQYLEDEYEPGEAAMLILEHMKESGMLNSMKRKVLEGIPEHSHEMVQDRVRSHMKLRFWLDRWWPALKDH